MPLLEPREALGSASNGSDCDAAVLAPYKPIHTVAGADLWIGVERDAASQADQLQAVENRPVALVIDDERSKFPAHLLAPVVAGVLH